MFYGTDDKLDFSTATIDQFFAAIKASETYEEILSLVEHFVDAEMDRDWADGECDMVINAGFTRSDELDYAAYIKAVEFYSLQIQKT